MKHVSDNEFFGTDEEGEGSVNFFSAFMEGTVDDVRRHIEDFKTSETYNMHSNGFIKPNQKVDLSLELDLEENDVQVFQMDTPSGERLETEYLLDYIAWKDAYSITEEEKYVRDDFSNAAKREENLNVRFEIWESYAELPRPYIIDLIAEAVKKNKKTASIADDIQEMIDNSLINGEMWVSEHIILTEQEKSHIQNVAAWFRRMGEAEFWNLVEEFDTGFTSDGDHSPLGWSKYDTRPDVGDAELLRDPFPKVWDLNSGKLIKYGWDHSTVFEKGEEERLQEEAKSWNYDVHDLYQSTEAEDGTLTFSSYTEHFELQGEQSTRNYKETLDKMDLYFAKYKGPISDNVMGKFLLGIDRMSTPIHVKFGDVFTTKNKDLAQMELHTLDNRVVVRWEHQWHTISERKNKDGQTQSFLRPYTPKVNSPRVVTALGSNTLTKQNSILVKLAFAQHLCERNGLKMKTAVDYVFSFKVPNKDGTKSHKMVPAGNTVHAYIPLNATGESVANNITKAERIRVKTRIAEELGDEVLEIKNDRGWTDDIVMSPAAEIQWNAFVKEREAKVKQAYAFLADEFKTHLSTFLARPK